MQNVLIFFLKVSVNLVNLLQSTLEVGRVENTDTVQLSSKVMFTCLWNACKMYLKCMQDGTCLSRTKCKRDVSMQAQNLII